MTFVRDRPANFTCYIIEQSSQKHNALTAKNFTEKEESWLVFLSREFFKFLKGEFIMN